jgi:hypothetical protein
MKRGGVSEAVLRKAGFHLSGNYLQEGGKIRCRIWCRYASGEKTYLLVESRNGTAKVLYVGETKTAARMFQYHNNRVMGKVRAGLRKRIRAGGTVGVWVCPKFQAHRVRFAGTTFRIRRMGLEGILIDHFHPPWNRKKGLRGG